MTASSLKKNGSPPETAGNTEKNLLRVAHMFEQHRDSELMRALCVLAVKCAREGLVRE